MPSRPSRDIAVIEGGEIQEPTSIRIALSMPSHDIVTMKFAYSMARMVGCTSANLLEGKIQADIGMNMVEGTYIHTMRQELVEEALRQKCTHMLWIDTDHTFPGDALLKLLARNKRVVGINYPNRRVPCDFVAIKSREGNQRLWTTAESTGLEQVEGIGFGLLLMQMNVLDELGDRPWFQNVWTGDPNDGHWMGEDVYFCRLLEKAGIPVYVDHDLSKECGHVGTIEYKLEHAEEFQKERLRQEEQEDGGTDDHGLCEPEDDRGRVAGTIGSDGRDSGVPDSGGGEAEERPEGSGLATDDVVQPDSTG
jgi:hypothetical protein